MNKILVVFVLFLNIGCHKRKESIKIVKLNDDLFAKGKSITDSVFHGEVLYYNKAGVLITRANFSKNKLDGSSIDYYPDGSIKDSMFYIDDKSNGFRYKWDKEGKVSYFHYSYFNISVGPIAFFASGIPEEYSFSSFDRDVLFVAKYDSLGLKHFSGNILNFKTMYLTRDDEEKMELLLYLLNPPLINIKYSLIDVNLESKFQKEIYTFNNNQVFIDTLLPILEKGHNYYLQADYVDLKTGKKNSYFQNIKESESIK